MRRSIGMQVGLCGALLLAMANSAVAQPPQDEQALRKHIEAELKGLEKLEELRPCQKLLIAAMKEKQVRDLFLAKLANPCYVFKDICCLETLIPEEATILFDFDCGNGCVCLVDPNFAVRMNRVNQKVIEVIDPYREDTKPCESVFDQVLLGGDDGSDARRGKCLDCSSDEKCREPGRAAYTAIRQDNMVYLFASGVHPTPGFRSCLEQAPERIIPPIHEFKITRPDGIVPQVLTPFTVCRKFPVPDQFNSVTVRDARGTHRILIRKVQ